MANSSGISFPQKLTYNERALALKNNLKWKYLISGIVLAIVVFIGSMLIFPDWGRSNGWMLVLVVVIVSGVVEFLANWRQAFEASPVASKSLMQGPSMSSERDESITVGDITNSAGIAIGRGVKVTIANQDDGKDHPGK